MIHLSFLDKLLGLSEKIYTALKEEKLEEALFLINNRDRLIRIIESLEKKINGHFKKNNRLKEFPLMEIYQKWNLDTKNFSEKSCYLDQLSFEYLDKIKKTTKEKISKVFVFNRFHSAYLTNSIQL